MPHFPAVVRQKLSSMVRRKKRSLEKMQRLGMEEYLRSKIRAYASSPSMVRHFEHELAMLMHGSH
ncbi:MAG TPA: hypothetical protein VFT64_03795 [Rickettsiales bacterium]|nr:hypothetical protein [Rickettsiales bacterium]